MKVRKKPVIVEAIQFTKDMILNDKKRPTYIHLGRCSINANGEITDYRFYISTLEGEMDVRIGEWIITGVKGEHYPCKPDIFKKTYEIL